MYRPFTTFKVLTRLFSIITVIVLFLPVLIIFHIIKNLKINVLQILFNMMVVRRSILVALRNIQCLISVIKKKNKKECVQSACGYHCDVGIKLINRPLEQYSIHQELYLFRRINFFTSEQLFFIKSNGSSLQNNTSS